MKKVGYKNVSLIILILIIGLFIYSKIPDPNPYSVNKDKFNYDNNRGELDYTLELINEENNIEISKLVFKSRNFLEHETFIHGLLFVPKGKSNIPGIVFLPAGAAQKEAREDFAKELALEGYGVLVIDQRGIGETGGIYLSLDDDFRVFANHREPVQHLSTFDALRSFDILSNINYIDSSNIVLAGESMGGRYALIATALDNRIKGYIGISTSGFNIEKDSTPQNRFMRSIDPDNYAHMISPRKTVFIHGSEDSLIPIESLEETFSLANEPKKLILVDGCDHGYCEEMKQPLLRELSEIIN